ncbi:hypothetical protein LCGC14_1098170 [marine sediment metagenome]|uniref:YopX protein domain-containing protein n=1 Tax=marine sediment metagenome TaxID=412755 RepID=A0A0F9MAG4_9ZZZZ|nr:hypothetical protein [bacterium]
MREHKYRAWDKKEERMYLPDAKIKMRDEDSWLVDSIHAVNISLRDEGIIWMQYTGLKDKNGKEVYEEDLLEVYCGNTKQSGLYEVKDLRSFYEALDTNDNYLRIDELNLEVVGNIYENPELLNV